MSISFSCSQCGKKLKAPESAAGKSSKCPGCGATVTCPEPVYDAELIESPGVIDPYADLETDKPYQVAGTAVAESTASGTESRRPCPMCGEMIVDTAAKCRFCGEVFDSTIKKMKKGKGKGTKARLADIAASQKYLIMCILLQVAFYIVNIGITVSQRGKPSSDGMTMLAGVLGLAILGIGLVASVFAFKLAIMLNNMAVGIILGTLSLIPCFGLIILLVINSSATRTIRESGHHVGFLGADLSEF